MYRVGIIGCGGISDSHYQGFKNTGRAQVVAAYDTDAETMKAKAAAWEAGPAESADALMDSDVDVVTIATPGFAHREYVERAAAAGKHILCEKPVALNMEDALAMKEAVERAGVTFMAAFNPRHDPPMAQLREVQRSGRIGGTVSAWARLHAPASSERWRRIEKTGHWRASMELSGGRINEFCSHTINWLLWVLGKPLTVYGKALCVTEGFNLDDADYALLQCENGVGLLEVNRHAGVAPEANYGIMGHGGSVVLKDGNIRLALMDKDAVELPVDVSPPPKHEHFLQCIESGEPPKNGIDDAIDTLRVCLAFNRSAESDRVEKC